MQNGAAASRQPAMRHRGLKLLQLRFKLLVDKQQSFHCTTHVAVTAGHYLINCGVGGV